jgi:phage host-nuclease inhibitor protein Gam
MEATEIVISNRQEAETRADEIIMLQVQLDALKAQRELEAAKALKPIKEKYEPKIAAKGELALQKFNALQKWVETNRAEVLGASQSFKTTLAEVGFRWNPPALVPASGLTWENVLGRIKALKKFVTLKGGATMLFADRFIRITEAPAVDVLKKDIQADLVDDESRKEIGVVLKREERFYVAGKS